MLVRDEDTVKGVFAIVWDPGKLTTVIIQKTGCQTDPFTCSYICKSCVMIGTVKVLNFT